MTTRRTPFFDQMIANYYSPGDGLKSHIDIPHKFDDGILVVSLKGTCVFEFTKDDRVVRQLLSPGDVVGLYGEARWKWSHGIPARKLDLWDGNVYHRTERISVTLRRLLPETD